MCDLLQAGLKDQSFILLLEHYLYKTNQQYKRIVLYLSGRVLQYTISIYIIWLWYTWITIRHEKVIHSMTGFIRQTYYLWITIVIVWTPVSTDTITREREREREINKERERESVCVCVCVYKGNVIQRNSTFIVILQRTKLIDYLQFNRK